MSGNSAVQPDLTVVWFKRDLRVFDHAPLTSAIAAGRVLPLYVVEQDYWDLPDTSTRQWEFLRGAVSDLGDQIAGLGGALCIHTGSVQSALEEIFAAHGKFRLVSHIETGNAWTYRRDVSVARWCKANDIAFDEYQQYGVWRGAALNRDK